MLATLFGVEAPGDAVAVTGTATGTKTNSKSAAGGKLTADGDQAKAGDGQTTAKATDAAAGADINLALLVPVVQQVAVASVPEAATNQVGTGGGAAHPVAAGAKDDKSASGAVADLAKLAAAPTNLGSDTATPKAPLLAETVVPAANAAPKTNTALAQQAPDPVPIPVAQAPAANVAPPPIVAATADAAVASDAAAGATAAPTTAAPVTSKEKAVAPKGSVRIDGASTEAAAGSAAALTAKVANALQTVTDSAPQGGLDTHDDHAPVLEAKAETAGPAQTPADPTTSATTTPAALIHAAAVAVRGAPQTVANLAAQIVKKLDGRSTQFNVQLDPIGLGKVDVRIAIGADGRMSAAMSFDTPQAAAELKSRSVELQQAMEQAGFDMSGGMSFDVTSDRGQGGQAQQQQADNGAVFRGRAFQAALDTTSDVPPPQLSLRPSAMAGVDIRI